MIFCNLKGGLGNMLFQIAATTSIAEDLKTTASFPNLVKHLDYLNNEKTYCPSLSHSHEYLEIFSSLKTDLPKRRLPVFKFTFQYKNLVLPTDCWIDGFFQSEKYFAHNREKIVSLLNHTEQITDSFKKYFTDNEVETISLHVRRGDYLKFSSHHPPLSIEYYMKALSHFGNKKRVLVFSDDISWCKKKFIGNNFNFVEEKDYIEMFIMSKCDYHIVANSSFSWWGAWLSDQKGIIAPKRHFGRLLSNTPDKDIYPDNWIRI